MKAGAGLRESPWCWGCRDHRILQKNLLSSWRKLWCWRVERVQRQWAGPCLQKFWFRECCACSQAVVWVNDRNHVNWVYQKERRGTSWKKWRDKFGLQGSRQLRVNRFIPLISKRQMKICLLLWEAFLFSLKPHLNRPKERLYRAITLKTEWQAICNRQSNAISSDDSTSSNCSLLKDNATGQ